MTLNREGKDSVHASEACMTLEEQTFTRALWCSVTGHLILHFHLQTFVTRLALIWGILTMQNV